MTDTVNEHYERAFANWLGVRHVFAFWKGRVALYAALRGLGVSRGDEVIMPGYTCVMAVNPIMYLGAKPVFVDIDPRTYNIDSSRIATAITPSTKLIIAQHTYGFPAAMDQIMELADQHGIPVIEDCCLALGSQWNGRTVGTIGRAAYFSSQWNKPYTTGLGGLLVTDDDALARQVRKICDQELVQPGFSEVATLSAQLAVYRSLVYPRTTAMAQSLFRRLSRSGVVVGSSASAEFTPHMSSDFFKGMSGGQAKSGLRQIRRLGANIEHRQRLAQLYEEQLEPHGWPRPEIPAKANPVLVRYPIRVADKQRALLDASRHGIELGSWFECPLHPMETEMSAYGYEPGMCPEAERASREVVNLPVHPRVSAATVWRSVSFIAGYK